MAKYVRYVDRFFDDENDQHVVLEDENGKEIEFEKVDLVDYDANYYVILHPVTPMDGVSEDEAFVFLIDEEQDCVHCIDDEDVVSAVFDIYYEHLDELNEE